MNETNSGEFHSEKNVFRLNVNMIVVDGRDCGRRRRRCLYILIKSSRINFDKLPILICLARP